MSSIYRKAALDRLSSPEQLDHLMEVTRPRDWIALGALGLVIFAALVWGIFGRIPTTVVGNGILMSSAGIFEVEVLGTGVVEELSVEVGDLVRAGQVVALVRQPELEQQIRQVEDRIAWLGGERDQLARFTTRNVRLETSALEREREGLQARVTVVRERVDYLESRVAAEREARELGLLTEAAVRTTIQELEATRGELVALDLQLRENEVRANMVAGREEQDLDVLERQLREAQQEMESLRLRLDQTSKVVSPYEGTVREIRTDEGQIVTAGSALLGLERVGSPLYAVVFIPTEGKRVQPGMSAQVAPVTVKREEFGFMLGTVTFVSGQPATPQGMMRVLRNPALAEQLSGQGAPFMVEVSLEIDPETASGFQWSSPGGPPLQVESGTLCQVRVVVREQRPISLVIPLVRRKLGLSA